MMSLGLPSSVISKIIDDPTQLGPIVTSNTSFGDLGISSNTAQSILDGYTSGFRILFILNAVLAAGAVVTSYFMIHHKELIRGDEEILREEAKETLRSQRRKVDIEEGRIDLEKGSPDQDENGREVSNEGIELEELQASNPDMTLRSEAELELIDAKGDIR